METKSINVFNLNIPCHNRCRYCLLSWNGKTVGIDYQRSVNYAKAFYQWLKINRPTISFAYYFGYSMEHPKLLDAIQFMQETNSPGGKFLQMDGMKHRNEKQLAELLSSLKAAGIKKINLTFYGTQSYHDKFAGRTGDFRLMANTLDIALSVGLEIEVGIPVIKENLQQLDALVAFFTAKNVRLFLFTPHSGGKGKSLFPQKITLDDFQMMSADVKKYLNRDNNKTPHEWLCNPPKKVDKRTLSLSLLPSNIDNLEKQSFDETLMALEKIDDNFYRSIPSFQDLLDRYVDTNDCRLYTKKDLYTIYRTRYIQENNLNIVDITDERFCGSFRY